MPRIIYAPSNGPACTMEDLVAQYIDWSPTIYNDVSQGFYMAPEQMQYCPTKSQIKNSASMSVTLYKQAVYNYKDSSIIQFKNGTTYKFNGEIGQFPKLYVLDMYPDFKPTKQYSSKELVKLCDVSAFYNHHDITLRLNNFSLIDGKFPTVSSNLVIDNDNVHVITDSAIYPYDMKEETYFSWSLPKIDYVANKEQYKEDKFTYNVIGYDNLAGPYTLGNTIDVTDVERDVMIDVYAEKKDLINVYISTDGRVRVINYLSEINLDSEKAVEPNIIIDPPSTYATYKTDYPEEKYDRFKFLIQPDDAESLESYKYEFKKNGVIIDSSSNLIFTENSSIYEKDLSYRDTDDSSTNNYTLMIITKEKYRGNNIRIIINNENADSLEIEVSEESNSTGFESVSSKTTSSKMEFSYVIQKEGTEILYIKVTGNKNFLKDYDLINSIYASNNRGESTDHPSFGNGTDSVVLEWTYGVGRNTIIYIKIERTQLLDVTIKRLTEDIDVHDNYSDRDIVFNKNSAIISTTKANPSSVNLTVYNRSALNNIINYKWYVRSKVDTNGYWRIGYNETENFKKENLIPGKSYMLELNGSVAYTEKIVSVIINNSDPSAHITVSDGEWSNDGNSYNTLSVDSSENEGMIVKYKYKMTQGYYFRGTIHVQEDYKFSSCSYTCIFRDKINSQMGSTISGSVEFNESINNFVIVIPNIPAECSYVTISTTYSSISTYSITVKSVANVNVYEYDYATQMFKVGSICTAENEYLATVNTTPIKPNEVKLKFVSTAQDYYPSLIYTVYDMTPSRQVIVSETTMDITGSGTVWTSPAGMFETYGNGIYFQVLSLTINGRTIYIYTTLTDVDLIIKDRYNSNNLIVDFSSNGGSNYTSYTTISDYYDRVSWDITWPAGYTGCDLELFGSDDATSPTVGNWVKVGSTKTKFDGTTLNFVWGHDLNGNSATEYTKYYIKFSNFMAYSFEYIGISTEPQSIDKISSYSKTNFIPTTGGKNFNVLFRVPTTSGTLSIIPPVVNDGVWVNPDGTSESSPYTPFKSFCGNGSNTAIDHTDGYTYIFYSFSENAELYGKYYINNTRYIYSNQTIRNAITFRNPKLTTETMDIDVYLDEIYQLSWVYDCDVKPGSHKEFSRYDDSGLYFWAKLEKMKSDNCDISSSKVVYEFFNGDLTLSPPDGFTLVEATTNPSYLYGGSKRWKFTHITFNENSYFTATLQHAERTITLSLKAITPATPVTYGTYFWYTESVTPYLDSYWYWWTTEDPNTTLLGSATSYGLGTRYNTPTSYSILDNKYYKCGPSNIAIIRNISGPTPVEMTNGQTYVLVYNTSQNSKWLSTGIKFIYINPTTASKRLICDGNTIPGEDGYEGCHYEIV